MKTLPNLPQCIHEMIPVLRLSPVTTFQSDEHSMFHAMSHDSRPFFLYSSSYIRVNMKYTAIYGHVVRRRAMWVVHRSGGDICRIREFVAQRSLKHDGGYHRNEAFLSLSALFIIRLKS